MANFKIALTAGHYRYTAGKRCIKSLDPSETREWVLNDRIADKIEKLLATNYTGYELIRTDDTTGETGNTLEERTGMANDFGADFYLSIHHNAGIEGGKGGGIVAYVRKNASAVAVEWQKALYNALIAATGLKGNRATPLAQANFQECILTKMPAVLLELGFMDSQTDVPVILSEEYADKCAAAIVKVLAERGNLAKKPAEAAKHYCIQFGNYSSKEEAEALLEVLKAIALNASVVNIPSEPTAGEPPIAAEPKPVAVDIDAIAKDVISGKYGNGAARKATLIEKFGADTTEAIQARVNEMLR